MLAASPHVCAENIGHGVHARARDVRYEAGRLAERKFPKQKAEAKGASYLKRSARVADYVLLFSE
jgi:hypothetical protein